MTFETRLADLGVTLPDAPAPAANYVPYVIVGDIVYVSGQISMDADGLILGKLGDGLDVEAGAAAARCCAIGLLAQVKAACGGDLERLVRLRVLDVHFAVGRVGEVDLLQVILY